jgi:hypothetical protein
MGGACSKHQREENAYPILGGNTEETDYTWKTYVRA